MATALALFLPSSGITRALFSIVRHSRFKRNRNPLERAAAAGALRMVVRSVHWEADVGDRIKPKLNDREEIWAGPGRRGWPKCEKVESEGTGGDGSPRDAREEAQNAPLARDVTVYTDSDDPIAHHNTYSAPFSFERHIARDRHSFHGKALLPFGYEWAWVHEEAKISWAEPSREARGTTGGPPDISSNYNWVQSLVAIFQTGSAALTLYRSRGDQIQRYGYAAFGLTVIPYLVMSIVNLVAQIATADYPAVYMVSSPEMDEARRRGGVFDGVVGRLEPGAEDEGAERPVYDVKLLDGGESGSIKILERVSGSDAYPRVIRLERTDDFSAGRRISIAAYTPFMIDPQASTPKPSTGFSIWSFQYFVLPILLGCLSLIVVGVLTRFENGESTAAQRGWIMSWLVVGIACGWLADVVSGALSSPQWMKTPEGFEFRFSPVVQVIAIILLGLFCVPALGGLVAVGGMLREYGICESS